MASFMKEREIKSIENEEFVVEIVCYMKPNKQKVGFKNKKMVIRQKKKQAE